MMHPSHNTHLDLLSLDVGRQRQSRHGSLDGHRQPLRASSANVGLGAWLSTVIYMVIYVDNSGLDALQKTPDPPWGWPCLCLEP